jgi:hypothetical protein
VIIEKRLEDRVDIDRARRMVDLWETEIDHPVMCGKLNLVQIALACALGLEVRNPPASLASAALETGRLVRPHRGPTVICNDGTTALKMGLRVHGSVRARVRANVRFPLTAKIQRRDFPFSN